MPRSEGQVRITKSVLDRLIDTEPGIAADPPVSPLKSLRELKQSVRRDLEWLLNSRQTIADLPGDYAETVNSLAAYGLPDFTAASVKSAATQDFIRRTIEDAIRLFEPRLMDVSVALDAAAGSERALRFRIDAQLRVDPEPEPVTFDTTLQLFSGEYEVKGRE
jgi:type VI secretion system protein ImpF